MTDQPKFSPQQFKEAQQALGLSDPQMAQMLGVSNAENVRRFKVMKLDASSAREVKPWHARLLQAYLDGYRPSDWPG